MPEERYLPGSSERDVVEHIAEIQHRLVVEEELLGEIRELERELMAEETGQKAPREERKGASKRE